MVCTVCQDLDKRSHESARDGALIVGPIHRCGAKGQDSMDSMLFHERHDGSIVVGKLGVLRLAGAAGSEE